MVPKLSTAPMPYAMQVYRGLSAAAGAELLTLTTPATCVLEHSEHEPLHA